MNGVMFGNIHSYHDLGLILSKKEIGGAEPKIELLEVEGANAPLDFTEFFGDIKYKNRVLKFEFSFIDRNQKPLEVYSYIQNKLNGRKMKIVLDEDHDYYYIGRVSVKAWNSDLGIGKVAIEVECEPYKYKQQLTRINITVQNEKAIAIDNLRKWTIPTFALTSDMDIIYHGKTYNAKTGVFNSSEILLKDGMNNFIIKGNGTITIEYQEGGL